MLAAPPDELNAGAIANLYYWLGNEAEMLRWIDRLIVEVGEAAAAETMRFDWMLQLSEEPRIQSLFSKYQLTEEQLADIEFNVALPDERR